MSQASTSDLLQLHDFKLQKLQTPTIQPIVAVNYQLTCQIYDGSNTNNIPCTIEGYIYDTGGTSTNRYNFTGYVTFGFSEQLSNWDSAIIMNVDYGSSTTQNITLNANSGSMSNDYTFYDTAGNYWMLNEMNTNTPSGMLISPVLSSDFLPYDLINNGVTIKDTTVTAQMSYVNCDIVLNDPNQYITGSVTWSLPPLRFYLSALAFKETS